MLGVGEVSSHINSSEQERCVGDHISKIEVVNEVHTPYLDV